MNKIQRLAVGQMIAFNYTDREGNKSLRVTTINEITVEGALCWCMTKLNYRKFLYESMSDLVIIEAPEVDKKPVGVGTTVYIIDFNEICAFNIDSITQDDGGYSYYLSNSKGNTVVINNPKHFNTTKTACANEWLEAQGLGKINEC
jgi:hypothetical protein